MAESPFPINDEEELRRAIRAEIEQRDQQRGEQKQQREATKTANEEAEKRRRIYQEELRRYYHDRPGYREIMREDGEVDWVAESEFQRDEKLFDEVLENPDEAKGKLKWVIAAAALFVVGLAAILYFFLAPRVGVIRVASNVPGAQIILDTTPLQQFTDAVIREVQAGPHVVTVQKPGFVIVGDPIRRINLKGGKEEILSFTLQSAAEASNAPLDATKSASGEQRP